MPKVAKEFVNLNGTTYIVCSGCRMPVGRQPGNPGAWAAYDDPGTPVVANGKPVLATDHLGRPAQQIISYNREAALCRDCYLEAFAKRYPEAEPPTTLIDGRVPGAQPVGR